MAPGRRVGRSGPAIRPAIRGIYTEAIGINADPRIGFYIDEIYQSRSSQGDAAFVDLERVEVQKGPQGTLFGRNSLGGNIALTTATPKDRIEGGFDVTAGNYGRIKAEAYYNMPLATGLAVRVAGSFQNHNGYLKSMVSSAADLEDKKDGYGRASLRWTPPGLEGRLEVLLHASYYHDGGHGYNNINAKVIGSVVDPALITKPGGTLVVNGVSYPFPAGYNGGNYATGTLVPYSTALRDNIPDVGGADIGIPIGGPYSTNYDYPAWQDLRSQNYSGTISFALTDKVRLKSITGYTNFSTINVGDGDGGPVPLSYYYAVTGREDLHPGTATAIDRSQQPAAIHDRRVLSERQRQRWQRPGQSAQLYHCGCSGGGAAGALCWRQLLRVHVSAQHQFLRLRQQQ